MSHLKVVSLVLAFAAVSLAVGTGAFSAVSADRGIEVPVVDDDAAMLGIENAGDTAFDNGVRDRELTTITNRFVEPVTVTIDVTDSGTGVPTLKGDGVRTVTLDAGDEVDVAPRIQCSGQDGRSNPRTETWTVEVNATGDTASVDTTAQVEITCTGDGTGKGEDQAGKAATEPTQD